MFGIKVDINNSEAIKAMGRMSDIASKELYENIGTDLVPELRRQFESHWRTKNVNTNTVYGAIKKLFFAKPVRGLLTSSTLSSIKFRVTDDGVEVGPVGSWPNSNVEGFTLPFAKVIEALSKTWMGIESQFNTKPLRRISKKEAVKGNVEMSWSASEGFKINWPDNYLVSHVYGLVDWVVKPHTFAGKSYRRNASKMEDFFDINMEVEKIAANAISQRIDVLWNQPEITTSKEIALVTDEVVMSSETEEVYKKQTGEQGWGVVQAGADIVEAIGIEDAEGKRHIVLDTRIKETSGLINAAESEAEELARLIAEQALDAESDR